MPQVDSCSAAVATPTPLAAAGALEVLKSGGNAVDAAVAGALAAFVMVPYQAGIGGYGGAMMIYLADAKRAMAIDFDSRAPLEFKPELYAQDPARAQHGPLAIGVPGVVAGLALAVQKFGTRKFADLCAPAIHLAEEGFIVDANLKRAMDELVARGDKLSIHAMLGDNPPPAVGQRWVQKDLANLLRRIADDPMSFYSGEIPKAIVRQVRQQGGILSERDFAQYQARAIDPIAIDYRGCKLLTPPPPAAGLTTLSILKTLEQFDLSKLDRWGAPYFELYCEAAKLCWQDRYRFMGDPDFVKVPIEQLLSKASAEARAARVRQGPWAGHQHPQQGNHTVNLVAIDRQRNLVSLTATQGETWGSRVAIDGLGLMLGHGMSRFTYPKPGSDSPNAPAPGKRMQHNMCPTIVLTDGTPWAAVGMVGGTRIVTITGQLLASIIDFGATPAQAVGAPRVHTEGGEPLQAGATVSNAVCTELEMMGHQVKRNANVGGAANVAVVAGAKDRISIASSYGVSSIGNL